MPKQSVEANIRDYLAKNIEIIEDGLVAIEDEYHLKNPNGANGFIDIFACDKNNNLVVIEIKRSDSSSREAITELSKYSALLRAEKNIKKSELRLILISTTWRELLVPFSDFFHSTSYQLEGYKIEIDLNSQITKIEVVKPLPEVLGRKICRRHFVRYYKTQEDLIEAETILAKESERTGVKDFIIIRFALNFIDEYYGATCGLYYAQQLKNKQFYENILQTQLSEEDLEEFYEYIEDFSEESDKIDELADKITESHKVPCETAEIGYPEKIKQRLNEEYWTISSISKYGVFNNDERLSDELIIADVKGDTGASFTHLFSTIRTSNRAKFDEVKESIENVLFHNDRWRHSIKEILEYAQRKQAESITIHIFNKDDILETIWLSNSIGSFLAQSRFYIILEYEENSEIIYEMFEGKI